MRDPGDPYRRDPGTTCGVPGAPLAGAETRSCRAGAVPRTASKEQDAAVGGSRREEAVVRRAGRRRMPVAASDAGTSACSCRSTGRVVMKSPRAAPPEAPAATRQPFFPFGFHSGKDFLFSVLVARRASFFSLLFFFARIESLNLEVRVRVLALGKKRLEKQRRLSCCDFFFFIFLFSRGHIDNKSCKRQPACSHCLRRASSLYDSPTALFTQRLSAHMFVA